MAVDAPRRADALLDLVKTFCVCVCELVALASLAAVVSCRVEQKSLVN